MSDSEQVVTEATETQLLTAEYKDGQLQIVEVTPYEKNDDEHLVTEAHILSEENADDGQGSKLTVLDTGKGLVQLDLLNLTLVRCEGDDESYRIISNTEEAGDISSDASVTCVLQSSDGEEHDNQETYVVVEGEQGPVVYLQSSLQQTNVQKPKEPEKPTPSPAEILAKAKAIQRVKAQLSLPPSGRRGRRRRGDLPPPHELLSSPNFKLFLYSCKLCAFKCNAIKELTAHKLMKHVQMVHMADGPSRTHEYLECAEVQAADVLVCGACGYETASKDSFRQHIDTDHGTTTTTTSGTATS